MHITFFRLERKKCKKFRFFSFFSSPFFLTSSALLTLKVPSTFVPILNSKFLWMYGTIIDIGVDTIHADMEGILKIAIPLLIFEKVFAKISYLRAEDEWRRHDTNCLNASFHDIFLPLCILEWKGHLLYGKSVTQKSHFLKHPTLDKVTHFLSWKSTKFLNFQFILFTQPHCTMYFFNLQTLIGFVYLWIWNEGGWGSLATL